MQNDRKQTMETRFAAYVGKPVNVKQFLLAIEAVLAPRGR